MPDDDPDIEDLRRRSTLTREMPPGFEDWHREEQVDYVANQLTRTGLIERTLARVDYVPDRDISTGNQRLTKEELAAIYLNLGGVDS